MTRVPKAKGRRDYGVAARGRAAKPDIGGGVPFARRAFSVWRDGCPYKPHVGAFVGRTYRTCSISHIATCSIPSRLTFIRRVDCSLAIRGENDKAAGRRFATAGERLFVCRASGQLDGAGLVDEPRDIEIAQQGAGGFAVDHADEQATKPRLLSKVPIRAVLWRLNVAK